MSFGAQLGALWKGITKKGATYFSGELCIPMTGVEGIKVVNNVLKIKVFVGKNRYKKAENQPDYIILQSIRDKQTDF